MRIYLEVASQVLVLIFVLTTSFSVGLLVSARQVLAALQERRSLALALCANFVVLPGAALALCWTLQPSAKRLAGSIAIPAPGRGRRLVVGRPQRGPTTLAGPVLRPGQHGCSICNCRP